MVTEWSLSGLLVMHPLSSSVSMKYVGKLEDGTVFDESERFKFTIGAGEVIKVVSCQPYPKPLNPPFLPLHSPSMPLPIPSVYSCL